MKKLHWKIILIASTLFLIAPYAGEFGNLKVKADETGQIEPSSSSSEPANTVESSQPASTEQSQSSTEPVPSQTTNLLPYKNRLRHQALQNSHNQAP